MKELYKYLLPLFNEYSLPEKHLDSCEGKGYVPFVYAYRTEWCLQDRKFNLAYSNLEKAIIEERDNDGNNTYSKDSEFF